MSDEEAQTPQTEGVWRDDVLTGVLARRIPGGQTGLIEVAVPIDETGMGSVNFTDAVDQLGTPEVICFIPVIPGDESSPDNWNPATWGNDDVPILIEFPTNQMCLAPFNCYNFMVSNDEWVYVQCSDPRYCDEEEPEEEPEDEDEDEDEDLENPNFVEVDFAGGVQVTLYDEFVANVASARQEGRRRWQDIYTEALALGRNPLEPQLRAGPTPEVPATPAGRTGTRGPIADDGHIPDAPATPADVRATQLGSAVWAFSLEPVVCEHPLDDLLHPWLRQSVSCDLAWRSMRARRPNEQEMFSLHERFADETYPMLCSHRNEHPQEITTSREALDVFYRLSQLRSSLCREDFACCINSPGCSRRDGGQRCGAFDAYIYNLLSLGLMPLTSFPNLSSFGTAVSSIYCLSEPANQLLVGESSCTHPFEGDLHHIRHKLPICERAFRDTPAGLGCYLDCLSDTPPAHEPIGQEEPGLPCEIYHGLCDSASLYYITCRAILTMLVVSHYASPGTADGDLGVRESVSARTQSDSPLDFINQWVRRTRGS